MTKRGAWPLLTVREMGGCPGADEDANDLNPQLVQLPDLMATSNVLDIPRQVLHVIHCTSTFNLVSALTATALVHLQPMTSASAPRLGYLKRSPFSEVHTR